jgi:hypothetical protein
VSPVGILLQLLSLPLAPARCAFWTIERVVEAAERDYYSPAAIRRELAELSRQLDEGAIGADEFDVREDALLDRLAEGERIAA